MPRLRWGVRGRMFCVFKTGRLFDCELHGHPRQSGRVSRQSKCARHQPGHFCRSARTPPRRHYGIQGTLPLRDHEVVLTFDDGPSATYTPRVLDTLAAECVKVTFFMVGSTANETPALVKRIYADDCHRGDRCDPTRDLPFNRLAGQPR